MVKTTQKHSIYEGNGLKWAINTPKLHRNTQNVCYLPSFFSYGRNVASFLFFSLLFPTGVHTFLPNKLGVEKKWII